MENNNLTSTEWLEKLKKRRTLCVIGIVAAYALNAVTFTVPSLQENTTSAGMIILHIALFLLVIISIVSLVYTIKGIKAIKNTGVAPDYIKKPKVKTYIIVLVSVLTVFSVIGIAIAIVSNSGKGVPDKANAVVIAEQEVRKVLKSPSTATFSQMSETTVTQNGDTWTIRGWVDAQNSFGATMRNNYTVVIKFSGNSYEVISCTVY